MRLLMSHLHLVLVSNDHRFSSSGFSCSRDPLIYQRYLLERSRLFIMSFVDCGTIVKPKCKASIFIASSQDGFISKLDGSVDWLNQYSAEHLAESEDDGGFNEFMSSVDALVMGRKTMDSLISMATAESDVDNPSFEWPYGKTPVLVLTSRPTLELPACFPDTVKVVSSTLNNTQTLDPPSIMREVEKVTPGASHVYLDGGQTIQLFMEPDGIDFIDRVIVTEIPLKLGQGRPFLSQEHWNRLRLCAETWVFDGKIIQKTYMPFRK